MFFAGALVLSEVEGEIHFAICMNLSEVETHIKKNATNIWCEWPISREIMKAAATNSLPANFVCNNVKYILRNYYTNNLERYCNPFRATSNKTTVDFSSKIRAPEVYIYRDRCRCTSCYSEYGFNSIENLCAIVSSESDTSKPIKIDMQRCTRCNKYFVDLISLRSCEEKNGQLLFVHKYLPDIGSDDYSRVIEFNDDSVLSRNGYYATSSTPQRIAALDRMLENGVSKAEIKDKLVQFIHYRGEQCKKAVITWKQDLEYVENYKLNKQSVVKFDTNKK